MKKEVSQLLEMFVLNSVLCIGDVCVMCLGQRFPRLNKSYAPHLEDLARKLVLDASDNTRFCARSFLFQKDRLRFQTCSLPTRKYPGRNKISRTRFLCQMFRVRKPAKFPQRDPAELGPGLRGRVANLN